MESYVTKLCLFHVRVHLIKALDYFLGCLGNLVGFLVKNSLTVFTLLWLLVELIKVQICFYGKNVNEYTFVYFFFLPERTKYEVQKIENNKLCWF